MFGAFSLRIKGQLQVLMQDDSPYLHHPALASKTGPYPLFRQYLRAQVLGPDQTAD